MESRPDLVALLTGLQNAGVEFIIVGGMAAVSQGVPTATFDLDIVPRGDPKNLNRLFDYMRSVHAHYRGRPKGQILEPTLADISSLGHCLLMTDLGAIDILGTIEQELDFTALLPHCVDLEIRGKRLRALNLEKIIDLKRQSTREKDRLALALFEETLRRIREK
jgi:predicted nucleotidyltransferase